MNEEELMYCEEFGRLLKRLRLEAGVSQGHVAKQCGFKSAQFISNLERGICWPPMNVLAEMSELYGLKKTLMLDHLMDFRKKVWASQLGLGTKSKITKK